MLDEYAASSCSFCSSSSDSDGIDTVFSGSSFYVTGNSSQSSISSNSCMDTSIDSLTLNDNDIFIENDADNCESIELNDEAEILSIKSYSESSYVLTNSDSNNAMSEDMEDNKLSATIFISCVIIYLKFMFGCSTKAINCMMKLICVS